MTKRMILFAVVLCGAVLNVATASAVTVNEPLGPNWFFQPRENLGQVVNGPYHDGSPTISSDGLTLIFSSDRPGGYDDASDLWQSTRASLDDPWSRPATLGGNVNSSWKEYGPSLSSDGLSLFFYRDEPGVADYRDLYQSTRSTPTSPWNPAIPLSDINSDYHDSSPSISADGLTLTFASDRSSAFDRFDLWQTTRASTDAPWDSPSIMNAPINTMADDAAPCLSADGLTLAWSSWRSGTLGGFDSWLSSSAANHN